MLKKAISYHPSSHHFYAYLEKDESGGIVSNEGGLGFHDSADTAMIDVRGIDIKDCGKTIEDNELPRSKLRGISIQNPE